MEDTNTSPNHFLQGDYSLVRETSYYILCDAHLIREKLSQGCAVYK